MGCLLPQATGRLIEVPGIERVTTPRKEVIPVEKRKEYAEGDIVTCPKCDSADVDYDEAPSRAKCQSCGLEFEIRTVAIWNE